jgi:hypothetical protein
MAADVIDLRFAAGTAAVALRELAGREERAVSGTGTADVIRLLDALVEWSAGEQAGVRSAADLTASDRDLLLAAIYQRAFGDRIESTVTCGQCGAPFDLHFSLSELERSINLRARRCEPPQQARFRLPTGRDEMALGGLAPAAAEACLLNCCTEVGAWPDGPEAFQEMLDEIAPLLDLELAAPCAECGRSHIVRFDIQSYLLGALLGERRRLLTEVHRIAVAYGWSFEEILLLTRTERRQLVELIENETARRPRLSR